MTTQPRTLAQEFRQSWLTVLVVALSAILLGWATGFSFLQFRFAGVVGTPSETVTNYLQAIAANDSVKALAELADRPADSTLLTDEVLRAAHVEYPMTRVRVTETNSARVPATFEIGGEQVAVTIPVTVSDGQFKVTDGGLATADLSRVRKLGIPVLVGGRAAASDEPALFPSTYPVTSGDDRFDLNPTTPLKAVHPGSTAGLPEQRLAITSIGTTAVRTAVRTSLTACSEQRAVAPAGCPFRFDASGQQLKAGSQRWVNLTDAGETFSVSLDNAGTAIAVVTGRVRFSAIRMVSGRERPFSLEVRYRGQASLDLLDEGATLEWVT